MADIEIRMLGKFEILMDGKPVLAALKQSRKATMLIQYLVLQKGEKVTHKDLTDTLWNGERSTNPDMALRAIMHRFRNMIEAEGLKELETCIITSRGYYQWNPTMECRVDVFEMEALMEEARRQLNPAAAVARYERVLELYAGRLLPMSCNEPWVETRSLTLHVQYRIALFQVLEACKRKGENERIVKLCRRAIELDPYEERLYLEMIQALEALGRHEQALEMTRRGNASPAWPRNCPPTTPPALRIAASRISARSITCSAACKAASACRSTWRCSPCRPPRTLTPPRPAP